MAFWYGLGFGVVLGACVRPALLLLGYLIERSRIVAIPDSTERRQMWAKEGHL